jgi:dephospho-CoA kinase
MAADSGARAETAGSVRSRMAHPASPPRLGAVRGGRLTGERPLEECTPDSLLALHGAGYREVAARLGEGIVLDAGCGTGRATLRLAGPGRSVIGVDHRREDLLATVAAGRRGVAFAQMDASVLAIGSGSVQWACSSHVIEHFVEPERHVAELARVLAPEGTLFVLTPNEPADFENPFHVHLFRRGDLEALLRGYFAEVWVGGLDGDEAVKADLERRRRRARRVLALDVFGLRHRIPRSWYVAAYTRLLPLAYRLLASADRKGRSGLGEEHFFVTDAVDDSTLVLFAIARRPTRALEASGVGQPGSAARPALEHAAARDPGNRGQRGLAVGLAGGIGSGKSTVAAALRSLGATVVDADAIAHELLEVDGPVRQAVLERFGDAIVDADGRIDRSRLAAVVFADAEARAALEAITHPAIAAELALRRDEALRRGEVVVLEVPLMVPGARRALGLDLVVVVDCPEEVAIERLAAGRKMTPEEARRRMAAQPSRRARLEGADVVVDNAGDRAQLRAQVARLWARIEAMQAG